MKILVIGFDGALPGPLFALPGLTNIRRIMDAGCYGRLECVMASDTESDSVGAVPPWMWLRDELAAASGKDYAVVRQWPVDSQWDAFQFVEIGLDRGEFADVISDDYQHLDDQVGRLLEGLNDQSAVLVLSDYAGNDPPYSAFILAAPNCPLSGDVEGVHLIDLAPTLLEIGGYDVPCSMHGRSLVGDACDGVHELALADADEEVLRQRLSGLGYI